MNDAQSPARKALTAAEAGAYLAERIGLSTPIRAQRMWHFARSGQLPSVRLGRRVWFQVHALDKVVATRARNAREGAQ